MRLDPPTVAGGVRSEGVPAQRGGACAGAGRQDWVEPMPGGEGRQPGPRAVPVRLLPLLVAFAAPLPVP